MPLVLVGFGVGSLIGTVVGGRLGDVRPHATTIVVAAVDHGRAAGDLAAVRAPPCRRSLLVVLLGLLGLSANPVLSSLAVRFAGVAPTLGVAMSVSAYNLGTAVGSWLAGRASARPRGRGPGRGRHRHRRARPSIPTVAIALVERRRSARARGQAVGAPTPVQVPVG